MWSDRFAVFWEQDEGESEAAWSTHYDRTSTVVEESIVVVTRSLQQPFTYRYFKASRLQKNMPREDGQKSMRVMLAEVSLGVIAGSRINIISLGK